MKPTPTPEMIDAFIIAKESADRRLYGFHNLGRHFILDGTTEVWFTASDDYEVGHAAMMAQLERLRMEAALSAALSVQPAAAVVGEPVAWMHPTANWSDVDRQKILNHCVKDGDMPVPLYAAPSAPEGWQPIETAPKDGTEILAYGYARCDGSRYANGQHIAWWDAELGWTGRDPDDRVTLHPSHWRPLPPRPELGGE